MILDAQVTAKARGNTPVEDWGTLAREGSDDRGYAALLFIMKVSSWDTYMHVYHNLLCDKVNGL